MRKNSDGEKQNKRFKEVLGVFFLLALFFITQISIVSAWDFDNVKNYDEKTKTITITNAFGLGSDIAELKLITPQINYVVHGSNRLVAEFEINSYDVYSDVFKKMEFQNIKTGYSPMERRFTYRYKDYETIDAWDSVCSQKLVNGILEDYDCRYVRTGTKLKEVWKDFDSLADLPAGKITIGLFTDVYAGDKVEWIPTLFGERINEWASWTDALNIDLRHYYPFNETSGTVAQDIIDTSTSTTSNQTNITTTNGQQISTGIIGYGYNVSDGDAYDSLINLTGYNNLTMNIWVNRTGVVPDSALITTPASPIAGGVTLGWYSSNSFSMRVYDGTETWIQSGGITLPLGGYYMMTIVINDTDMAFYVNGSIFNNESQSNWAGASNGIRFFEQPNGDNTDMGNITIDEFGIWNRSLSETEVSDLWNNGAGITYAPTGSTSIAVTLNSPQDTFDSVNTNVTFNCSATTTSPVEVVNISLLIDGVINTTKVGTGKQFEELYTPLNFSVGGHTWTCKADSDVGSTDSALTRSLNLGLLENSATLNYTTYETKSEELVLNVSYNSTLYPTISARLNYGNTSYSTTKSGSGTDAIFTRVIDIPINAGTNTTFNWTVTMATPSGSSSSFNSTSYSQFINTTFFSLCNNSVSPKYVNFTFKNESDSDWLNATIQSSTFIYWLGTGTTNKTLSFTNLTLNNNYTFCLIPQDESLNVNVDIGYKSTVHQQRRYVASSIFTNTTTHTTLWLLSSYAGGLYSPFQVVNPAGDPLRNVKAVISRSIGGSTVVLTSDYSDSSGILTFYLDPDYAHSAVFSLAGYTNNEFTFTPTTDTRIVTMGGGVTTANATQVLTNTSYQTFPSNSSLSNNTDYVFGFNVTSGQTITYIEMNITNETGGQIGFQSQATSGYISETINTANYSSITGYFEIQTADETISFSRVWAVGVEYEGTYSLYRQLSLYLTYGFNAFIKFLIVLIVLISVLIFMSSSEITDTSESKIIVSMLIVWGFSILGWLDTGIITNSASVNISSLNQFANQYGIAIVSSAIASFFIMRRVFTTRV